MRVVLVAVLVLCCAFAQAKLVDKAGQGVILDTPPVNVFDQGPNDVPSATLGGALAITAFDEKQHVVLSSPITISTNPTVTLQPNVAYDSFFLFFHQKSNIGTQASASANFTVDNRVIGCTQTIADEFETTPFFGLTSVTSYPTSSSQVGANRGYEPEDGVVGVGTVFRSQNTIVQPGDYTRCFSHSCSDVNGNPCSCSASLNACLAPANEKYHCFSDPQSLVDLNEFSVSSSCLVDKTSAVVTVKSCDSAKGCRRNGTAVCLRSSSSGPSSVDLHVTAGCSCALDITATFNGQASGSSCYPADTELGCKSGANVLVYGKLTNKGTVDPLNKWADWLQTALPGSIVSVDNSAATITPTSWSGYDLVITALLPRIVSSAEAQNVADYVNNGGALIALAGFQNDQNDINRQQSVLANLGVSFVNNLITFNPNAAFYNYNPANPLINGLAGKWISYAGGWPSTPTATGVLFAQQAPATNPWDPSLKSVGQTIVLPSGGKIVAWGDEWATFLSEFTVANNGNEIFWKNAVSWVSNICVAPPTGACDANQFTVSASCTNAAHTSSGKGFTLKFSSSASNCN